MSKKHRKTNIYLMIGAKMEKLIELLNEYDSNWGVTGYGALFNSMNEGISEKEDLQVISKKFGFIKWLVDNDKIDKEKVWKNESPDIFDYSFYEVVLMLLSISDTPIEDLIRYLK